jgi:hypothetical protein
MASSSDHEASWDLGPSWAAAEEEGSELGKLSSVEAGELLADLLIDLKARHVLSAKQACSLAYFASKAGACGFVGKIGFRPDADTGAFSKHWDRAVGRDFTAGQEFYNVPAPQHHRADYSRRVDLLPTVPPHEFLEEEVNKHPEMLAELAAAVAERRLPPAYYEHPIFQSAPPDTAVHPLCLYVDGVPITRSDSALGLWVQCFTTGRRSLAAVLRKSDTCKCGCKGYCTLFPVLAMLDWSFQALAVGEWPRTRHSGEGFGAAEAFRRSRGGAALGFRALVLFVKGDWMEWATTFGFQSWASTSSPCFLCKASPADFYSTIGLSAFGVSHPARTFAEYEAACSLCEHLVTLDAALFKKVRASLEYDIRQQGSRGRRLLRNFAEVGLECGDRLEPSKYLADIGDGFDQSIPPVTVMFWRPRDETYTKHRVPIFNQLTAVTPDRTAAVDYLHALSLGVFGTWCSFVCWVLLQHNVFGLSGSTQEARLAAMVIRLRADLFAWYRSESLSGREHSRVQNITTGLLGAPPDYLCGLHGAETNGFLFFCDFLIKKHSSQLPPSQATPCLRASAALCSILDIIRSHGDVLPPRAIQNFIDATKTYISASAALGVPQRPKLHMLIELAGRCRLHGNPKAGATWHDESLNAVLKRVAGDCHRLTWSRRVLTDVQAVLDRRGPKRERLGI